MDSKKTHNVYTTIFSLNFQIVFFFFYSCWFLAIFVVPRPLACATFVRLKTKIFHCSLFTTSSSTSTSLTFPTNSSARRKINHFRLFCFRTVFRALLWQNKNNNDDESTRQLLETAAAVLPIGHYSALCRYIDIITIIFTRRVKKRIVKNKIIFAHAFTYTHPHSHYM